MAHSDSIKILASVLRVENNKARPVFLLGAGASFSSRVPLASECVRRIARCVYAERIRGGAVPLELVKLSEWQTWLQAHDWYIKGEDRLAENFPLVVANLLNPREYRRRILLDLTNPGGHPGEGYRRLAELVMRGLVRTILTTNFDTFLPAALRELLPHLRHFDEINRSPGDLVAFDVFSRAQIVWLHGKAEQYADRNLIDETQTLDPRLVDLLTPLLASSPLVVIGYRGAEPSIVEDLLAKNVGRTHHFRNGIYWCTRRGEAPHAHVESLSRAVGTNFRMLEILDFDTAMTDLCRELAGEDAYDDGHHSRVRDGLSFDDKASEGSTLKDIDLDLALAVMKEYCTKLGRAPLKHESLLPLLRELGLVLPTPMPDTPTVACVLLFGRDPQSRFPHAIVSATTDGKRRVVFSGNLLQQRQDLIEWLDSPEVNPVLQVKRRARHEDRTAYPPRALVELMMNALVHRDYATGEATTVDVTPGERITFRNPGRLLESAARRVTLDPDGGFRPVPSLSELRNAALCDVFFGYRAMERAGTGLVEVDDLVGQQGGTAVFRNEQVTDHFSAIVTRPTASAGSSIVARDSRAAGVYVLNLLQFASLPEQVSIIPLNARLSDRSEDVELKGVGTFIQRDKELWSFVPRDILVAQLRGIADAQGSRVRERLAAEGNPEDRKVLSWLLRKHFERHLTGLCSKGLTLEEKRSGMRRAYFVGVDGGARAIRYDTPRRKGVQRQVVKQRADTHRPWFENEGFGYEVVWVDHSWAVRVKPFYMFTGRDARTPLPAFTRTSRATRRMKLDRNKNVEDDLTFWARFLSGGAPTVNIGQEHVEDLLLESCFLAIEVTRESEDRASSGA